MKRIYEGTIDWIISDDTGDPHWVELINYLYVPKGGESLISHQHWAHNKNLLIQMIIPWMSPSVSLTMIAIPRFWVLGDSFTLQLLTSNMF